RRTTRARWSFRSGKPTASSIVGGADQKLRRRSRPRCGPRSGPQAASAGRGCRADQKLGLLLLRLLFRLADALEVLVVADRVAHQLAQHPVALHVAQDLFQILVDGRVIDDGTQRAFSRTNARGDGAQIAGGLAEVGEEASGVAVDELVDGAVGRLLGVVHE